MGLKHEVLNIFQGFESKLKLWFELTPNSWPSGTPGNSKIFYEYESLQRELASATYQMIKASDCYPDNSQSISVYCHALINSWSSCNVLETWDTLWHLRGYLQWYLKGILSIWNMFWSICSLLTWPSRSAFAKSDTHYLGYVFGNLWHFFLFITTNQKKNPEQTRSYLGIAGFYSCFVPHSLPG